MPKPKKKPTKKEKENFNTGIKKIMETKPPQSIKTSNIGIFMVNETYIGIPKTQPELLRFKANTMEFRKKLEEIMREHRVGVLTAFFLHKF